MILPAEKKCMPDVSKFLNGESPIERAKKKKRRVCWWIFYHGAASAEIIRLVANQKSNGYARQLVNSGLLVETKTKSGNPRLFFTLSQSGQDLAKSFASDYVDYNKYQSPLKISQNNFEHDFHVQKLSLEAMKKYKMKYVSQSQLAIRHAAGVKVPDGLWIDQDKVKIAIEVEFSQKFGRALDNSIFAIIQSLIKEDYNCYFFFVRSTVIKFNYREAMKGGRELCRYVKNDKNRWVKDIDDSIIIPDWLADRVFFMLADHPLSDLPSWEQMLSI